MKKDNPQLEDGYTRIANKLFEAVIFANITDRERRIVLAIMRETYGWGRKVASISRSRFAKITGIDPRDITKTINSLTEKELIKKTSGAKMKYGKPVYKYEIIKKHWWQFTTSTGGNSPLETGGKSPRNKEIKEILKKGRKSLVDNLTMK